MAGLPSLSFKMAATLTGSGFQAPVGLATGLGNTFSSQLAAFAFAAGVNTDPGQADELYVNTLSIAASGNSVIDLAAFLDISGQSAALMARVKGWFIALLGAAEIAPNGTAGTPCTGLTVGAGTNPFGFGLSTASVTFPVNNASYSMYVDGSANGIAVSTNVNVKILNADSVNAATVFVVFIGGSN